MKNICEFAPAKVNLTLAAGPKADDGYHPLQSLVSFADIGDHLTFEAEEFLCLEIKGPFGNALKNEADNLVLRAARALQNRVGQKNGARIVLQKELPLASGIGGGSADAAATLRGLNRLWDCRLNTAQMEKLGESLGADVPVCVQGKTRFMCGRGEKLSDITSWPTLYGLLVNPGFAVSTAEVFRRFDAQGSGQVLGKMPLFSAQYTSQALLQLQKYENALSAAACDLKPDIKRLLGRLSEYPQTRFARLCGSGATCLALTENAQQATEIARSIKKNNPNYWVKPVALGSTPRIKNNLVN